MRAYLAVIQDSFREALASRVLWVLLGLITLLLLALAPFGHRRQVTRDLGQHDVRNWPVFLEHLRDESQQARPSPAQRIVSLLEEPLRSDLRAYRRPDEGDVSAALKMVHLMGDVRKALNQLLARRDFYDQTAWGNPRLLSDEARELSQRDSAGLSDDEAGRLNRLALEVAYPDFIVASPPTSVRFRYLGYDFGEPLPIRATEYRRILEGIVEWVIEKLVGVLGVLIAILVTASIIPQTFDPGSLNLLLSKPVWRWLLFLTKFAGGCMFILLNGTYLVIGLWLILGFRFGLWNPKLLLCIPVYVFLFAVYYTVSALAGVLWRNAIVSVVVSILFWLTCFLVGTSKSLVEQLVLNKTRVVQLLAAKQDLFSVNEIGLTHRWDEESGEWQEVFRADNDEEMQRRFALAVIPNVPAELRPLGPVYDEPGDRLISAARSFRTGQMRLSVGPRDRDWTAVPGAAASLGTQTLLREPDGRILVVSSIGLYRLVGDPAAAAQSVKLLGFSLPLAPRDPFAAVGPDPSVPLLSPAAAALNQDTSELVLCSRGRVTVLRRNAAGRYELRLERRLDPDYTGPWVLAAGGDTVLAGREDGRIVAYDAQTLEPRQEFTVEGRNTPRFITAAPGGQQFAVVFHHGTLWSYDRGAEELSRPRIAGQRDISCCVFTSAERALVADRATRVTEYELPTWHRVRRYSPPLSLVESIYRYGLVPLYTVFPKPGELDKTVQYVLSGKETAATGRGSDLSEAQRVLHPWRPVWSSLAFMAVVLTLGCWYLQRQDF